MKDRAQIGRPVIARCRSCGARIRWIKTRAGKRMPVDEDSAEPVRPDGRVLVVTTSTGDYAAQVTAYTSHFATCPNADAWRNNNNQGDNDR